MPKPTAAELDYEIRFFESVLRRDPGYVLVVELLGGLYTRRGRIADGLRMDRRLVRLQPANATAIAVTATRTIAPLARAAGAWVHVDGAFGLPTALSGAGSGTTTTITRLHFHTEDSTGPLVVNDGTIVGNFINQIYEGDRNRVKSNVMFVNCAHGKGIKFIRDELKYFAKANMQCNDNNMFKSIVLMNADELTIDAQSALRRCIELFSHNTRFFIIVENKYKLLALAAMTTMAFILF